MVQDPHHRIHTAMAVMDKKKTSTDQKVLELLKVMQGKSTFTDLMYALDKFKSDRARIILDSFLLANTPHDVIRRATDVPPAVIQAYRDYIFDVSVFRDHLDKIDYVSHSKQYLPRDQQAFYEAALNQGGEYITWLLNRGSGRPPKEALENIMTEGLFMGQSHRGSDPTSERARQARSWFQLAAQAATNLQRLDPRDDVDALEELRLALTKDNSVQTADDKDAPQPDTILH